LAEKGHSFKEDVGAVKIKKAVNHVVNWHFRKKVNEDPNYLSTLFED